MKIREIRVKSWNDIASRQIKGWIFRGQQRSNWQLKTNLERAIHRFGGNLEDHAAKIEGCLLREFMRRSHHYTISTPGEDEIEWFSLMQHHGAPTRLLDWTMSIYVASYFALEACEGDDCSVWLLDQNWLHRRCKEKRLRGLMTWPTNSNPRIVRIRTEKYRTFDTLFGRVMRAVAPVNSHRLNERLTIQKGLFLCPGDTSIPFMENLSALNPSSQHLQKLVIPAKLQGEFIERLYYMGIDRATLFPGLDGFAQSLGIYQPHVRAVIDGDPHLVEVISRFC